MGHTESGATWIGFASSVCHDKGCVSDCHVPDVDHTGHRKTEGLSGRERGNERKQKGKSKGRFTPISWTPRTGNGSEER